MSWMPFYEEVYRTTAAAENLEPADVCETESEPESDGSVTGGIFKSPKRSRKRETPVMTEAPYSSPKTPSRPPALPEKQRHYGDPGIDPRRARILAPDKFGLFSRQRISSALSPVAPRTRARVRRATHTPNADESMTRPDPRVAAIVSIDDDSENVLAGLKEAADGEKAAREPGRRRKCYEKKHPAVNAGRRETRAAVERGNQQREKDSLAQHPGAKSTKTHLNGRTQTTAASSTLQRLTRSSAKTSAERETNKKQSTPTKFVNWQDKVLDLVEGQLYVVV